MTSPRVDLEPLLGTLIERWREVADSYSADKGSNDDLNLKYDHYRTIYLRLIRDLQHVLDVSRLPCSLMDDEERLRGDCGRIHVDGHDKHGSPTGISGHAEAANTPAEAFQTTADAVSLHIAQALLSSRSEEVRSWARELAHELRREQVDLTAQIRNHVVRMALGSLAGELPF